MRHRTAFAAALTALALSRTARARDVVIDAACTPTVMSAYSISYYAPLGQEFVPAATRVHFVDLWISASIAGDPAQLRVRLRRDTIDGDVVGESDLVSLQQTTEGPVRFPFGEGVTTAAGERHVIEVVHAGGSVNVMLGGGDDMAYDDGRPLLTGQFLIPGDFWFRIGVDSTTPARSDTWGAIKARYR